MEPRCISGTVSSYYEQIRSRSRAHMYNDNTVYIKTIPLNFQRLLHWSYSIYYQSEEFPAIFYVQNETHFLQLFVANADKRVPRWDDLQR